MIDFVLPWVDGNDPIWLESKKKYEMKASDASLAVDANSNCRYRDNGLLKFLFRGIENYTPWVNKIHFITCGHLPSWLNTGNPKINIIQHTDFIPQKYLPTFNVNTIEMNLHRIPSLSEQFVYLNDDIFLLCPIDKEFFFKEGNPVLITKLKYPLDIGYNNWSRLIFNDYCLVNNRFNITRSIWENKSKWFSVSELGFKRAIRNFLRFRINKTLPVHFYGHLAIPHLKSSLCEIWDCYPEIMDKMSQHKFRSDDQVNQWLIAAWDQARGRFFPTMEDHLGINIELSGRSISWACSIVRGQSAPQVCLNESEFSSDLDLCTKELEKAFESILPHKSSFEK